MADFPLVPNPDEMNAPPPVPSQQETAGLADRWKNYIGDPHNRAALIQFGLALSQPIPAGQNALGHVGQAIGQGGEASDRVTRQDMAERELSSKEDLRSAQAESQIARAGAAETRAAAAGQRADFGLERIRAVQENTRLRGLVQLHLGYNNYAKNMQTINDRKALLGEKPVPILSQEEWIQSNPSLTQALTGAGGGGGNTPVGGVDLIGQARNAIRQGANRDAVLQRLREKGVEPPPDL